MKDSTPEIDLFDFIGKSMQPNKSLMELNAVWIEKGIRVFNEHSSQKIRLTHRIAKGDFISLNNDNTIKDYGTGEVYEILKCMGTIDNSVLEIEVKNIETEEIKIISI